MAWSPNIQDHTNCQHQDRISQAIKDYVISTIIMLVIIGILFLIYFDPLGLQTPSLIEELSTMDVEDDDIEYDASDVTVMVHKVWQKVFKGKIISKAVIKDAAKVYRLYNTNAKEQWLQWVKVLLVVLAVIDARSILQALEDIAHGMAIMLEGNEFVLSDFVAGLMLVYRDQKE